MVSCWVCDRGYSGQLLGLRQGLQWSAALSKQGGGAHPRGGPCSPWPYSGQLQWSLFPTGRVPSVTEWSKAPESDASAGGESPVRDPVRAATLCPYA